MQQKLKLDLKKLANSELVGNLTKHITTYEKKVKQLANDFDLKSREAREKGQKQLDKLATQFKRTRSEIEKRVSEVLHTEGGRLNQGVADLVKYLKTVANSEKLKAAVPAKKKASKANGTSKKTSSRKTTRRSKGSASEHGAGSAT